MPANPYPGTAFDKTNNRWKARITANGITRSLGTYATQLEAYAAVEAAKQVPVNAPDLFEQPEMPAILVATRKNTKVAQHNWLVETRLPLSLLEARIFVLMLRCLHKYDEGVPAIVIPISELFPGTIGGNNYKLLVEAADHFMKLRIELPVLDREVGMRSINLVQAMEVDPDQGVLVGAFSPMALPYVSKLTDNFTVGVVDELMSLKSANTHSWYWLMKSWAFRSPVTVSVNRLREMTTETGSYQQYADFRNKVLRPSIDELNGLSFEITFSENKKGRAVDSVRFNIGSKKAIEPVKQLPPVVVAAEKPKPTLTPLHEKVSTRLSKLKLTEAQIRKVLQVLSTEAELTKLLKETYPVLRDFETQAKPGENVAAATMVLLKSTFPAIWAAN
ncbi:MAG: RepB family plasmid replication initiator protein [Janthinobacterium lividum]